jgi:DNA-directed RNA polymerase subunit RPC12/RpoP
MNERELRDLTARVSALGESLTEFRALVLGLRQELHGAKARLDLTMRGQLRCPACGCRVIVRSPQVLDRSDSGRTNMALVQPSVWSTRGLGELVAYVCSECGLVEWYVKDPQELLKNKKHFEVFEGPEEQGPYR